ncbi:MAG: 4-hydroxy-tetrahydrodipicolinate synthase [Alphaproteobacteria bacterium]
MFTGSIVALITPFRNNCIDKVALENLIEWHLSKGTKGIVVCGSTGEALLLSAKEREYVAMMALKVSKGKIPIIMGCAGASTEEVIKVAKNGQKLGVSALLVVSPYYVKPSQEGLFNYFTSIHNSVDLPIILYNNPGRCGVNISHDLLKRLCELPRIVALKDSTDDLTRPIFMKQYLPKSFSLLCGEDSLVGAYLAHGGNGWISVSANIIPYLCSELIECWKKEDHRRFEDIQKAITPLHNALSKGGNPASIKYALSLVGKIKEELKAPLIPAPKEIRLSIKQALDPIYE